MNAAKIEIGWVNKWFKGETPSEIVNAVEEYQDFGCLISMGRLNEEKRGQKELDKLEKFLEKYYARELTMEDIEKLEIHLSIGDVICHGIAEGDEAVKQIKE